MPNELLQRRLEVTRNELRDTLDAIEDRLNVPKQLGRLTKRIEASYHENPAPWVLGLTGAVVAAGGVVTALVLRRR